MYDIITVGSATIDAFAKTAKSDLISIQTQNKSENESFLAYPTGTKIIVTDLEFTTGGGGTNTAVSVARLGMKTAFCGKLDRSDNGISIIKSLKKEKVDFIGSYSKDPEKKSGFSIILDSIARDRTILTYKGCNNDFKFEELNKKKLNSKWFYFCAMVEKSFEELAKLAKHADEKGIKIMFNPSSYLAERGQEYLNRVLVHTDILCLNREEASYIVGKHDCDVMLEMLRKMIKGDIVIITDGKDGVHVSDGKYHYFGYPHGVKPVETTGAGDAFGSSFLAGLIKKNDINFAISIAITNAESVIQHHGAKNNLLRYRTAMKNLKERPVKIKKKKIRKGDIFIDKNI